MSGCPACKPCRLQAAVAAFKNARAVCFDVDSTVLTVEAIDEFAAFVGRASIVTALTTTAMNGRMSFRESLEASLGAIQPTTQLLQKFLEAHPFVLTPHVRELISSLQRRGTRCFLVSGGFTQMIYPVADTLGVDRADVFANTILFGE